MKRYLLFCLVLGGAFPSFGQGRDTAFAIHKLFIQRRGGGEAWVTTGAGVAVDESIGWRAIRSKGENARAAAINGGIPMVLGMRQALRFSAEREAAIIKRYHEGWSLPPDVRRKLKRKHFRRTTRDVLNAKY